MSREFRSRKSEVGSLQTPHSGYHWDGSDRRFFEGWYFRVTLPEIGQSFAFMYSIDDPIGGKPHSGGCAQILGPDEGYFCRTLPDVKRFWASCDRTALGHWNQTTSSKRPGPLAPNDFEKYIADGYQVTQSQDLTPHKTYHQGTLQDPVTGDVVRWQYDTTPVYGWGPPQQPQKATAGWLSYFPIFEPGWQILMAHGHATGWIEWQGHRYTFEHAPAYAEKNWGGAFPTKWFWLQCNAFEQAPNLALTAAGGIRQVLNQQESVALAGLHDQNHFYQFVSTETQMTWEIHPWGLWQLTAQSDRYQLVLKGQTQDSGGWVRVPTRDGLQFICRDTTHGQLRLQLYKTGEPTPLIQAQSQNAGLEIGGSPWETVWSI